tara:strand:- start:1424 stop:2935 length:1512 start_codon:yes stop_codon:yes gene_type:complete
MYFLFIYSLLFLLITAVNAENYFLDSINGNDSHSGLSAQRAWRSLDKINRFKFKPGDNILLMPDSEFLGQFKPVVSGEKGAPIKITATNAHRGKPKISAEGKFSSAIHLENVSHWIVDGLEITNTGNVPEPKRMGIYVVSKNHGTVESIILRNLFIHDVNGVVSKELGGGFGIKWESISNKKKSSFDGLLVENCTLLRCDRNGIAGGLNPWTDLTNLSKNVKVRNNTIIDVGGDGIIIIGCDGALIEYNRIYGARNRFDISSKEMTKYAGPSVGIWPWSSLNTHVRFNEVWGYEGTFDGQGFDSDYNCSGSLFEYNFSANNAGGFFLVCNWGEHEEEGRSIGNQGTIIRHNISFNDRLRGFVLNGPVEAVSIYGNIIFNTIEEEFPLFIDTQWGGFAESVVVENNIFFTAGLASHIQGKWNSEKIGEWKYQKPISTLNILFRNNSYSNISGHNEEGMVLLENNHSLKSLIALISKDQDVHRNLRELIRFLKSSKYWEEINKYY